MLVELTPRGRETADVVCRTITELETQALAELPEDAIAGMRACLRALTDVSA